MSFELETEPGAVALVRLRGELDIACCDRLEEAVDRAVDDGASTVIVDLSSLEFLDSSGLRTLLKTDAELRDRGVRLAVVRGSAAVHRVFQITRTEERLNFVDDPSEVASDVAG